MTRLTSEWICEMENTAALWDKTLLKQTGLDYRKIAAAISRKSENEILQAAETYRIAVVPITSGLGTISSFSESVAAIIRTMGFDVFVTEATDVNGVYEAYAEGADIIYMADDDRYIALNIKNCKIGDNNEATAAGYVKLLERMAGNNLEGKDTVVLGYGIIGRMMAAYLAEKGAKVSVYDKDISKKTLVSEDGYLWLKNADSLLDYKFIADATSEGGWLTEDMVVEDALIAAPGIPLSLTLKAQEKLKGRYVHDLLEIGTAGMLGLAL